MDDAWGEMLREEFPDYTDEDIHYLIDKIENLIADSTMEIYNDVVNQEKWEKSL